MANLFKRTATTVVEASKVVVAGTTQVANVVNDGWDKAKDNNEWIKSNAEAAWNQAVSTTRASAANKAAWDRVVSTVNAEDNTTTGA